MGYGDQPPSGWQPGKNPHRGLEFYRKNGVPRIRVSGTKSTANEKNKNKKPPRHHGSAAPSGPMRDSGYGTKGGSNHQSAANRRTIDNRGNKYSGGAFAASGGGQISRSGRSGRSNDYSGGAFSASGGGQVKHPKYTKKDSNKGKGNGFSPSKLVDKYTNKLNYGPSKSSGGTKPGLERRAQGAKMGTAVSYGSASDLRRGAGNAPRSSNAFKDVKDRRKEGASSIYTATGGDSWGNIAKRAGVSVSDLKKANNWQMKNRKGVIYRNSKIYIPGGSKRGQ